MVGDDELGKTRGQTQQQTEESTEAKTPEKPKIPRDSTMVVTAKVKFISSKGIYIVKNLLLQEGAQIVGDQELEKTRAQTGDKNVTTSPISPKVKRQTTVGATVEVKSCVLITKLLHFDTS